MDCSRELQFVPNPGSKNGARVWARLQLTLALFAQGGPGSPEQVSSQGPPRVSLGCSGPDSSEPELGQILAPWPWPL